MLALTLLATAGAARADRGEYRYHARTHAVAAGEAAYAYSPAQATAAARAETPALGELAITGQVHHAGLSAETRAELAVDPWLSGRDVSALVAPREAEIEHCYVAQAAGGKLDLTMVIGRAGNLISLTAAAPGLSSKATHQLEACVRTAVADLAFPARRHDTTAVVPYLFHKASAAGAGPVLSCWSARGC
ncbi:MAG TPA: hypothetical protein VFP84_33915 [Kofleriaceae bacterium]|nr:hypothetical protein [Kofleriaceae bacterium]